MTFIDLNFVAFIVTPAVICQSAPAEMDLVSIKFAAYCRVLGSEGRNVLLMKRTTAADSGCSREPLVLNADVISAGPHRYILFRAAHADTHDLSADDAAW